MAESASQQPPVPLHVASDIAPMVPADCDVSGSPFTLVVRHTELNSRILNRCSAEGFRTWHVLRLKSIDQRPSGTLPVDDIDLARLADFGRDVDAWMKIKTEALDGWVLCTDSRLHHPDVALAVNNILGARKTAAEKGRAGAKKRWGQRGAIAGPMPADSTAIAGPMPAHKPNGCTAIAYGEGEGEGRRTKKQLSDSSSAEARKTQPVEGDGFEEFWKNYPTDANMSKKQAAAQWHKLPPKRQAEALAAIPAFTAWCTKNSSWYRPVHAARFLSQERFEGFEKQKAVSRQRHPSWNGSAAALIAEIGEGDFVGYFENTELVAGPPCIIRVKSEWLALNIPEKYAHGLTKVFGEMPRIEVAENQVAA